MNDFTHIDETVLEYALRLIDDSRDFDAAEED